MAGADPGTDATRAGMCERFTGAAFTFCVAYCEARECDRQPAGDERCQLLRRGFDRVTGNGQPPCLAGPVRRLDAAADPGQASAKETPDRPATRSAPRHFDRASNPSI
jgi:hypothetical protein